MTTNAAKVFAGAVLCAVFAWTSSRALDYGVAENSAANELQELGQTPSMQMQSIWRIPLERSLARLPADPSSREIVALSTLRSTNSPAELKSAEGHLSAAIQARPGSPYQWATLAAVKYRLGETDKSFERAIVNAMRLGPYEPEVQQTVADYGLAVLDEVEPATRAAIERALDAGMKRNPREILQIASRRGRLDAACRHLAGEMRTPAAKWIQLCQSMEATP